jgi:hypothetical protein
MAESKPTALPALGAALEWIGFRVDDMNGSKVARVQDIYVDAESEEPAWVIVKVGYFGKVTAVPYADCADGPRKLWVAHSRKAIRSAPSVEAGEPLTQGEELKICNHYWIRPDQARAAAIQSPDAITSRSAGEELSG